MLGLTVLLVAAVPANDVKKELGKLQGTWVATKGSGDGNELPAESLGAIKMVIAGDKYTFTLDDYTEKGTLQVDPSKTIRTVDAQIAEGQGAGDVQHGIYELKGETLTMCFAKVGKDEKRPAEFSAKAGTGHILFIFKRESK
jgi:uncharacterized protein (TIGR03067 family)